MKAFVLAEPGKVQWYNAPEPELTPYGAILEPIAVTPCSSDVHTVFGGGSPKQPNLVLGHESIGRVVAVGEYVKDFKIGDKVAVPAITPDWREKSIQEGNDRHASAPFSGHQLRRTQPGVFSERYLIKDADTTLAHIPEGITDEQALMSVDVVTTGFTGAEYADIKFGDTVCVIGIGPIGLMAVAGARLRGAGKIIAIGTRPVCVELAKQYGANQVLSYKEGDIVEQIKEITHGVGVDSTIIAGGTVEVLEQAYDMTRYGIGTISNINYFGGKGYLPLPIFSGGRGMCGKTLHMELAKGGRTRIERIMSMIENGRVDPSPLITHHMYGLERVEDALYLMRDKPDNLVKVMVHCK